MEPSPRRGAPGTAGSDPSFVAETHFSGCVAWCLWPRKDVERLLPDRLQLRRHTAGGRHPLVFVFGQHDRSAVLFASLAVSTGVRFLEMVVAVPFVRQARDARPSVFLPRVFSGEPVVTWSGNAHYGFAKRMVPMEWIGDIFTVSSERGKLLAHATAEPAGPWQRAAGSRLDAFGAIAAFARLPVLGYRSDGSVVRSRFDWGFEHAWIRPARARVSMDAPLAPGLSPTQGYGSVSACLLVSGMRWRLTWPETWGS